MPGNGFGDVMLFWIIAGLIVLSVLALFARALLVQQSDFEDPAAYDLRVYKDQLQEVDRDVARGVLNTADAERVRTEISRRILAADTALGNNASLARSGAKRPVALVALAAVVLAGAFGIYTSLGAPGYGDLALADRIALAEEARATRPTQKLAEESVGPVPSPETENEEYVALVERLRVVIEDRPDDVRGFRLLARAEGRLGNLTAAHQAQARVLALTGGKEADVTDLTDYADMLILAAGGYVSPEAEAVLATVLERAPGQPVAQYYWGLMHSQTGRPDMAFRIWDRLLRRGPPDAPWIPPIQAQIEEMALRAGVRYDLPVIGSGRGPSAEDIEAAQDMSPAERMQMIEGMVSGLATRLADEGGPPQDWAQLISALGVLGRMEDAASIYANARDVFGADPGAMDLINSAADQAGLR